MLEEFDISISKTGIRKKMDFPVSTLKTVVYDKKKHNGKLSDILLFHTQNV